MDSGEITASKAVGLHFLCVVGLAAGYGIARVGCDLSLVTDPARTLRLLLVRHNPPFAFFVGFTGRSKWDGMRFFYVFAGGDSTGRLFRGDCSDFPLVSFYRLEKILYD
ncbi:hypothetical protein BHE74_00000679 [Ensete ventricosum]|nr:hypothetical protein BHE74_00000679 [Ensete ventricosum]RZR77108.1 hypothetical protein BHM03_00002097 [Ensete ventricosum]